MNRALRMLLPGALVLAAFSACGGSSAPDLFSGVDGGGAAGNAGSRASAGSTSAAGQSSIAGNLGTAGESSGGSGVAGAPSGSAGAPSAGAPSAGGAGAGGAGAGSGGASSGTAGSTGTAGSAGNVGSAGGGGATSCSSLFSLASTQLQAATACNLAQNSEQCTGKEKTTCGCQVAIEKDGSPEAQAYEDTLKQISDRHCTQACPAIACLNVSKGVCKPSTQGSGNTTGTCSSGSGLPIQSGF